MQNKDVKINKVYVRKKDSLDFLSKSTRAEIENSLKIKLADLKVYRRYDMDISDELLDKILYTILAEKPVDLLFYGE